MSTHQICAEEDAADGTVGATPIVVELLRKPSNYTPTTIAVETTATRFN